MNLVDILREVALSMGYVNYREQGDHFYVSYREQNHWAKQSGYSLLVLGLTGSRIRWGQFLASADGSEDLVLWHGDDYTGPSKKEELLAWVKDKENNQRINVGTKSSFEFELSTTSR